MSRGFSVDIEVSDEQLLSISKDQDVTDCLGELLIEGKPTRQEVMSCIEDLNEDQGLGIFDKRGDLFPVAQDDLVLRSTCHFLLWGVIVGSRKSILDTWSSHLNAPFF